jgi:ketosteroid isomerase-like protein
VPIFLAAEILLLDEQEAHRSLRAMPAPAVEARPSEVRRETMASGSEMSAATLRAITDAFNAHDLDAIMEFFADDCSLDMPRGPEPWGQRFTGKQAVRKALATRFQGLPDVRYSDDRHWVNGDLGVSEWLLSGTTPEGRKVRVRGCDHWEFRDGKVVRKDSYWKIVEKPE